jgi:hypothetical protein
MRKAIAILLAILLIPAIPVVDAESNLIDVGIIDSIDGRFIHTSFSSSSTLLTLTSSGNLSEHFWGSGELITQWSIELNVSANSATPDSNGLQVAVAYTGGVYVVNTQLRIVTESYNTSSSVDSVLWDNEGDLWFGHFGGERRAKEYDVNGWTGVATPTHNTAMTTMAMISDNRIVTGGRDNLVKITTQSGVLEHTLPGFTSYPTKIINDGNGNIIIGCANGDIFRYDFTDWSHNETSISSGQSIISINMDSDGRIMVGTQNGNLHILDSDTFTEEGTFPSAGRVMMGAFGSNGELYIISSFSTSSNIRLYDLDTDGDGVTDNADAFPLDATQEDDTDGDGYGDDANGNNSDKFPYDVSQWADEDGDGHGDNPDGNDSDAFINNSEQWYDSDGDGYGDNIQKDQGDRYPEDSTQWSDSDGDGFGDEVDGVNGDNCPTINGFSTIDRRGCKDSDSDGYSNPTENWTIADGADTSVNDKSQWVDYDGDSYGDNLSGNQPDTCPTEWGNSTNTYVPEIANDGSLTLTYVVKEKFGCIDSDGDGFYDFGDDLPNDARDYIDSDGDEVGASQDYNDSNKLVQTEVQHCESEISDRSEICLGIRDVDYQNYVMDKKSDDSTPKGYYDWERSLDSSEEEVSGSDYLSTAAEIAPLLGIGFATIVAVLLIYAAIGRTRRRNALVKAYGIPLPDGENSAEDEVLKGNEGLSGAGGIDDEHYWDDEVKPIEFINAENESDRGFDDIEIKGDGELPETSEVLEESSSIEELAGLPKNTPAAEVSTPEAAPQQEAPETPPVPSEGLPDGWTMEQWKWYGAEWLSKQGK